MQNTKLNSYYKILSKRLGIYYKSRNEITLMGKSSAWAAAFYGVWTCFAPL